MTSVAVVGGGIAGLSAAWELARAGAQVELYEATAQTGGAVAPVQLAGLSVDAGAEAFATRSSAVADLITDLGLAERIVSPHPAGAWLQLPRMAAPLPATGVLGVPGDPQAEDVVAILGAEASGRAAEDFSAPMTWTAEQAAEQQPSLGEVVRDRMGEPVVEQLVSPITSGVHSAAPDDLAISAAHPQLYETMLRHGSLARAVAELKAAAPAGSAVQSLQGGMNTLTAHLQSQLQQAGGALRLNTEAADLRQLQAEHIVLAVDEQQAVRLASPYLQAAGNVPYELASPASPSGVALVTLLVCAPELDGFPRGTGMLVAPTVEHIGAKAMTHISAKWQWVSHALQQKLGPGHHLLRLSYGRVTDEPGAGVLGFHSSDAQLLEAASRDVPALTGVRIGSEQILDTAVVRWKSALAAASAEHRERAAQFRRALAAQREEAGQRAEAGPQLWAVGAWLAGTGLSQVIPHARQTAAAILARD